MNPISDRQPDKILFQGANGSYSDIVGKILFPDIPREGQDYFEGVAEKLVNNPNHIAVLPIENSIFGSVHPVLDILQVHSLFITAEYKMKIEHCLVANEGARIQNLKTIYSHPQALGQCSVFLSKHSYIQPIHWHDTATAARKVADNPTDLSIAAIASTQAALVYNLQILRHNIENFDHNFTRFVVVEKVAGLNPAANKSSLVFETDDNAGALYRCLGCFADQEVNLLRIENRPVWGKAWKQLFYVDFQGNFQEDRWQIVQQELEKHTIFVKPLGSYQADDSIDGHKAIL